MQITHRAVATLEEQRLLIRLATIRVLPFIGTILVTPGYLDRSTQAVIRFQIGFTVRTIPRLPLFANHYLLVRVVLPIPVFPPDTQSQIPAKTPHPFGIGLDGIDLAMEIARHLPEGGQIAIRRCSAAENATAQTLPVPVVLAGQTDLMEAVVGFVSPLIGIGVAGRTEIECGLLVAIE